MIDYKKQLRAVIVKRVTDAAFKNDLRAQNLKKELELPDNVEMFYFGNIEKKKAKAEMRDLKKFKPREVVSFYLNDKAISTKGEDISSEFNSIYFTVKK